MRIVDEQGVPFSNARVVLYPTPSINPNPQIVITDTEFTDLNGYAIFDYTDDYNLGQASFAVLNIGEHW